MPSPSLAILRVQTDERLVALARAGHERPFEAIVERYRRPLLRHARRLVGEARAEDVVQQALLAAWAAIQRGDDVRDLAAWLHRIAHNTALNALRGQRDHAELGDVFAAGGAPHDVLERRLSVRETLESLAALPERQREALLRTALEGRSQAEVAQALGLSDGAVRQLVHRARTAVRAAATALTPLPAVSWLASAGTRAEPMAGRVAELVAGSAGARAALAKAGAIAVLAGGAATGPALIERDAPREARAAAQAARPAQDGARDPAERSRIVTSPGDHGGGTGDATPRGSSGPGSRRSGSSGRSARDRDDGNRSGRDESGSSSSGSGSSASGSGSSGSGSSGSGSSGSGSSGSESGSSGSGSASSGSGSSGSGSSGSGSGSSGSGSGLSGSGSGSSGSGSGSSGSDSSGTTSSGSGSGESGSGSGESGSGATLSGSGESGSGSSGSGSESGSGGSGGSGSSSGSGEPAEDDVASP